MPEPASYDLAVVGGGINGAGIACDAAGRGLKVILAEMNDLASATSSASSKLIHGGLRYLEHYEFKLVREALAEREVLLAKAPHIIWPLRFVLPHVEGLRPRWMIRAGLGLYDNLYRRKAIPGSKSVDLTRDPAGAPLAPGLTSGSAKLRILLRIWSLAGCFSSCFFVGLWMEPACQNSRCGSKCNEQCHSPRSFSCSANLFRRSCMIYRMALAPQTTVRLL